MNLTKLAIIDTKAKLTSYLGCLNLSSKEAYEKSREKLDQLIIENHSNKSLRTQLRFMDKVRNYIETAPYLRANSVVLYIHDNAKLINENTESYRTIWGWIEAQAGYEKARPKRTSNLSVHPDEVKEFNIPYSEIKGFGVGNYACRIAHDSVFGKYYGYMLNVSPFITFEAETLEELKKEFAWTVSRTPIEQYDHSIQPLFKQLVSADSLCLENLARPEVVYISISDRHNEYATYDKNQRLLEGNRTTADHVLYLKADLHKHLKHFI